MKSTTAIVIFMFAAFGAQGQITIKKPKINVEAPKVGVGSDKSNSNDGGSSVVPKADPSGLFTRITDDPSARSHRAEAVKNLELLEAEYAKDIVDYSNAESLMEQIDKRLGMVMKLEPNVGKEKFDDRYNAVKEPVSKDLEVIKPMKEMAKTLRTKFSASGEYQEIEVIAYRKITGYRDAAACYCREHDQTGTYAEYEKLKQDYLTEGSKVPKYKDEAAEKSIAYMDNCLSNSVKYVEYVSTKAVKKDIVDYNAQEKPANPTAVISKCGEYLEALGRIETDPSLNLPSSSLQALKTTKAEVARIKTEAEVYISSGEFEKYKAAMRAERAKLVEMPKAVTKSPALESQAINYILKGQAFKNYLASTHGDAKKGNPVSSIKAVSLHSQPQVKKNALGVPVYQFKEIVVAYKDTDGLCQIVSVYAEYEYKGGGTYSSEPRWAADAPIQIACENVNK